MFSWLYLVWFLFPLTFLLLGMWSFLRPYLKVRGKENTLNYFAQAAFCFAGFILAVMIDRSEKFEQVVDWLSFGFLDLAIARWLLFPAILLIMAWFQQLLRGKKQKERIVPKGPTY